MKANILKFNDIVHLVVGDVSVNSEAPVMTSKMLIGVEFVYVCS